MDYDNTKTTALWHYFFNAYADSFKGREIKISPPALTSGRAFSIQIHHITYEKTTEKKSHAKTALSSQTMTVEPITKNLKY